MCWNYNSFAYKSRNFQKLKYWSENCAFTHIPPPVNISCKSSKSSHVFSLDQLKYNTFQGHYGYPGLASYGFTRMCGTVSGNLQGVHWLLVIGSFCYVCEPTGTECHFLPVSYIIQNYGKPIALPATSFMLVYKLAHSLTLKMEATCSSKMPAGFLHCYISEDRTLHSLGFENIRPHKSQYLLQILVE
jgi:hypothetical protein